MLLRLIKYPGSKSTLIPDIKEEYRRSGKRTFIDVFGGSGIVSLNVPSERTVYNDLDTELVNLFLAVRESPEDLVSALEKLVSGKRQGRDNTRNRSGSPAGTERSGVQHRGTGPDGLSDAARTLYRFTVSFGGMGSTYDTEEKSVRRYAMTTLEQFEEIRKKVSAWTIENLDFRELIEKHDGSGSFFYFDPPYSGKKWYDYNFQLSDYEELAEIMKSIKGRYLLNLNSEEEDIIPAFGKPDYVRSYQNKNQDTERGNRPARKQLFYRNF